MLNGWLACGDGDAADDWNDVIQLLPLLPTLFVANPASNKVGK